MYIRKVVLTVACLVLPPAQFRLYYALYVYSLSKAVALADKLIVVLIFIDRSIELKDWGITSCIYSDFTSIYQKLRSFKYLALSSSSRAI